MASHDLSDMLQQKQAIRLQARAARRMQPHKDSLSRSICAEFAALPEYLAARTVLVYLHTRSEVRTQSFVAETLQQGKRLAVPYCVGDDLKLFLLERMDDLAEGSWGILEPKDALRVRKDLEVDVSQLDLAMVPGTAFDRRGGRIGYGKGYYDRLLRRASLRLTLVALAFECQMFDRIPMGPADVHMDKIITEQTVYSCPARRAAGQ